MKYQRGQAVVSHSLIYFIIALMVLVGLLVYLTLGNEIIPRQDTNLDDLASQCDTLCSLRDQEGFCENIRPLVIEGKKVETETCASLAKDYPNIFQGCSFFSCSNSQAYSFYSYVSQGGFIQQSTGLGSDGVILNVFNTQMDDVLPDAFKVSLDDINKARAILAKSGIDVGNLKYSPGIGARFSSALILFQLKHLGKEKVTGLPNKETLDKLTELDSSNQKIDLPLLDGWEKSAPQDWGNQNGRLNINDLVVLPSLTNPDSEKTFYAFAEKETAIAWAFLIREVMNQPPSAGLNVERFLPKDADCVYRPYYNQVALYVPRYIQDNLDRFSSSLTTKCIPSKIPEQTDLDWKNVVNAENWIKQNCKPSNKVCISYCLAQGSEKFFPLEPTLPGGALDGTPSGDHSRAIAIDFYFTDAKTEVQSKELNWFIKDNNNEKFGFCPCKKSDGSYLETWHWFYNGNEDCNYNACS